MQSSHFVMHSFGDITRGWDQPILVLPELDNEETISKIYELHDWLKNVPIQPTLHRWPANTNIKFNVAMPVSHRHQEAYLNNWLMGIAFDTHILVHHGVNMQALEEKLNKIVISEYSDNPISLVLTPLKELRHNDPVGNLQAEIKFAYIQIFAIAGLFVILCALFNHLTLYVTRVGMRLRELALRKVNGATNWQIAV